MGPHTPAANARKEIPAAGGHESGVYAGGVDVGPGLKSTPTNPPESNEFLSSLSVLLSALIFQFSCCLRPQQFNHFCKQKIKNKKSESWIADYHLWFWRSLLFSLYLSLCVAFFFSRNFWLRLEYGSFVVAEYLASVFVFFFCCCCK